MLKIIVRHKLALAAVWALSMTGTSAHGDIIHACVLRTTGALRIMDANKSCAPNERRIQWDQIGPAGPAGPAGSAGPAGPEIAFAAETTKSWLVLFARAARPTERSARLPAPQQRGYVYVGDLCSNMRTRRRKPPLDVIVRQVT